MRGGAQVRTYEQHGVPIVSVEGEIDLTNVEDLAAHVFASVADTSQGLIVDLSTTSYLDSAGLSLLLELQERLHLRQQMLRVIVPSSAIIRRVFEATHIDTTISLYRSVEEALAHLNEMA